MNRQIRTKIDVLLPSPIQDAYRQHVKAQPARRKIQRDFYHAGSLCYVRANFPRDRSVPKWLPAVIVSVFGARTFEVKMLHNDKIRRVHWEQLRPRFDGDTSTHDYYLRPRE